MRRIGLVLGAGATALLAGGLAPATPARAGVLRPAAPTGVHVVAVSGSSVKVAAARAAHATGYRLYVSTRRSDLYVRNAGRAHASSLRRQPRMTVGRLRYSTAAFYYRVAAVRGAQRRFEAAIHVFYLRPGTPSAVRLARSGPAYLTWTARPVTGYRVEQATNAAMTAGRRTYAIRALTNQFTPYGLVRGRTYWFRLRAVNHGVLSRAGAALPVRITTRQQPVSVMTYNVLEGTTAGTLESGTRIATWAQRRPGVVRLILSRHPDVLAVQEAAAWVGPIHGYGGTRQVDDLTAALGGGYALARTETPPTVHGYRRAGNYLLYQHARWSATGVAGHWDLGEGRLAAYAVLRSRTTGARVLVVSAHLAVGAGGANDAIRQRETVRLVRQAGALAAPAHLPVIYAGDFNSDVNKHHDFDGPGIALRAARVADAEKVAGTLVNGRFNSANLYLRTPPAVDQSIDYVFAGPGVGVAAREVVLELAHGRFVGVIPSDHNPVLARLYVPY